MLNELKFVKGAVSKKGFIPALTHFCIENNHIRSYNGSLALCSPIQFDLNCAPKAIDFIKAADKCNEAVSLSMTEGGRLRIISGSFRAFVECLDEPMPHATPEGDQLDIDGQAILDGLKIIKPFVGDDASRPWAMGALFANSSIYATNNVSTIQCWIGNAMPLMCAIRRDAIDELVRINEPPTHIQYNNSSVTFHYSESRWVWCNLISNKWPDINRILDIPSYQIAYDKRVFQALNNLEPFSDVLGRIYFLPNEISTSLEQEQGATYEISDFQYQGCYQIKMLRLTEIASTIDFTTYPKPVIFQGENFRGAVMGMRPRENR